MLHLDDVQLYDLSEAGRLLFKDPARLEREARLRKLPAVTVEQGLALPAPWVDAEAGISAADPIALGSYWLARLAPPSREARRPRRGRDQLPPGDLLAPDEAAARLFATPEALERLDREGRVPSLRVDDAVRYDAALVDLVAREDEDDDVRAQADARRAQVREWARYEYGTVEPPPPPPSFRPAAAAPTPPAAPEPAEAPPAEDAPKAFEIPDDLDLGDIEPLDDEATTSEPSTLMDVEGFETVDED